MTRCPACNYPLTSDGFCGSCHVRRTSGLPQRARCETCKYRTTLRCCRMGPHSVCTEWKEG